MAVAICRYGLLDKNQWPNWSVGALANSNAAYGGPTHGCGYNSPLPPLFVQIIAAGDLALHGVTDFNEQRCQPCMSC